MSKAFELQNKLEILTDEVKDLFHATQINLQALTVQASHKNSSKELISIIQQCQNNFKYLKNLLDDRSSLRLNYLITQQIKQEEAKVRRQRLSDYEDKILDQRRLISDKESFYENLLRPKKKRPQNMPLQEFQQIRRREISDEENRKYKWLKEEVDRLTNLYNLLKQQNNKMNQKIEQEEKIKQREYNGKEMVKEIENSPSLYDKMLSQDIKILQTIGEEEIQFFKAIKELKKQNSEMIKEYLEEKQMHQYLTWENKKLVQQYKQQEQEIKQLRNEENFPKKNIFERPVSR